MTDSQVTAAPVEATKVAQPVVPDPVTPIIINPVPATLDTVLTSAEKAALQKEAGYLRDMLRAQTIRCDDLENEVCLLNQSLNLHHLMFKVARKSIDIMYDRNHIS